MPHALSRYSRFRHFAATGLLAAICAAAPGTADGAEPIRFWSGGDEPANLVEAVGAGDLVLVNTMLVEGADVNAIASFDRDHRDTTPLAVAAARGYVQIVEALIAAGATVNAPGGVSRAMMLAAAAGHVDVVRALLAANANVNGHAPRGPSALKQAVGNNQLDMVKVLLAAKADPSPMSDEGGGRSALFTAVMMGYLEVAMLLVEAGADVNAITGYGDSPLRQASSGNTPAHLALVKALLARGADVEAGKTPSLDSLACEYQEAARRCAIGVRNADGTSLGLAVRAGNIEIVQALLDAGAKVDTTQSGWQTPLMIAAATRRADIAKLLLAKGASTTAKDARGRTALMLAMERSDKQLVDLLSTQLPPPR